MFQVSKFFLDGPLKGLTITERTSVRFKVGQVYGGGRYRVVAVLELGGGAK
jgi:hypothetical protein